MEKSIVKGMKLSKRDIRAAEIFVEWNHEYWRRIPPSKWGCKRRRSFTFTAMPHNSGADGGTIVAPSSLYAKSQIMVKGESSKPAFLRRKRSLKKKKGDNIKTTKHLTKKEASLNHEIDNVDHHRNQPKALILKFKIRKQELSNDPKRECKIPNSEIDQPMQLVHANGSINPSKSKAESKDQKQQQLHLANHNQTLGQGPLAVLDLNIVPKEFIHVDSCQPLDATMANEDLSGNLAAQTR